MNNKSIDENNLKHYWKKTIDWLGRFLTIREFIFMALDAILFMRGWISANFALIMLFIAFLWVVMDKKKTTIADLFKRNKQNPTEEIKETKNEQVEHITLQEAATLLIDETPSLSNEVLQYIYPLNRMDMSDIFFYERDNPNTIHKETLPDTTIHAINLCLHVCKKNNTKIYGKIPSFSAYAPIPFEKIQYFDASYTKLYSDISRDSTCLIYSDVSIIRDDFKRAIENTDMPTFVRQPIHN